MLARTRARWAGSQQSSKPVKRGVGRLPASQCAASHLSPRNLPSAAAACFSDYSLFSLKTLVLCDYINTVG